MLNFASNNTLANSSATAASAATPLALASDILTKLGLDDRRAEVITEEQTANHQYQQLRVAIENFSAKPNAKNKIKLTKALDKEINRLEKEHNYIKAKQLEYQQKAEQSPSSSNYFAQWRDWFVSGVKQFFGSDPAHQAQRYAAMAGTRQEQINKLKQYRVEVRAKNKAKQNKPKETEEDIIELNTDDASPMRRRLLTIELTEDPFRVNTYAAISQQERPSIGVQPSGSFIIAWQSDGQDGSDDGIYARHFNASGYPLTAEFQVNTVYTSSYQRSSAIGVFPDGRFIIAWAADIGAGNRAVRARSYSTNASPLNPEFQIHAAPTTSDEGISIGIQSTGNCVVTWSDNDESGSPGVSAQRISIDGLLLGNEFQVNTYTSDAQRDSAIGVQPNNDFVIVWESFGQDGDRWGIYAQRFNATSFPIGSEFRVNTYTISDQLNPQIAIQSNGEFIVTWQSNGQDGDSQGIYAQRFSATAFPIGSEFRVNTYTSSIQQQPAIAVLLNDSFVIIWETYGQYKVSNFAIGARRFNSSGFPLLSEFRIDGNSSNFGQYDSAVATRSNGDFVAAWTDAFYDSGTGDVGARILQRLAMEYNTIIINQGERTSFNTSLLNAVSTVDASQINFYIADFVACQIELSTNSGVAIMQFSLQQLIDGTVELIHDGSSTIPSFTITTSDGQETLPAVAALINFTPAPAASSSTGVAGSSSSTANNLLSSSTSVASSSSSGGNEQSSSGNNVVSSTALASSTATNSASSSSTGAVATTTSSSSSSTATPNPTSPSSSANNQPPSSTSVIVSSSTAENAAGGNGGSSSSDTTTQTAIIAGATLGGVAILSVFGIFACRAQYQKIKLLREKEQARQQKDQKVGFVRMAHEPNQDPNKSAMQVGDSKNSAKKDNERLTVELVSQPPRANELSASSSAPVHTPPPMQPRPGLN